MCLTAKNFGLQELEEENIISKPQGKALIRKTGWGTTKIDIWTERERKRECFKKKEDKSLIYVENVETTGERFCHLS